MMGIIAKVISQQPEYIYMRFKAGGNDPCWDEKNEELHPWFLIALTTTNQADEKLSFSSLSYSNALRSIV